jgi:hypothetical protein
MLFGVDIDPWAVDACGFVLLAEVLSTDRTNRGAPIENWRRIRMNLACMDTLMLDLIEATDQEGVRDQHSFDEGRTPISRLFPSLEKGPNIIVGNPPYAELGHRSDIGALALVYTTLAVKPRASAELYLLFLEQMTRLANKQTCACSLVLPLSLACNVGNQFHAARAMVQQLPGRWEFAFFDREPHALFGEDVKTRNTIVFWTRESSARSFELYTGPLQKWRGGSRAAMLKSIQFTPVNCDVQNGIPKVGGNEQAKALRILNAHRSRLKDKTCSINKTTLAKVLELDRQTVLVGGTAYNFINVFLKPTRAAFDNRRGLSESPLHKITCDSTEIALAVFAALSSRLTYWWWHVHGDGFHVSKRFISDLPIGAALDEKQAVEKLARDGARLWIAAQAHPIWSLNRGRVSLGYTPSGCDDIRESIDELLIELLGLRSSFGRVLATFTSRMTTASLHDHL